MAITARNDKKNVWCLPKGLVERDETPEETALREVKEETGLIGEIVDKIGQIDYWFYWNLHRIRYHKFVHFYLMKYVEGDIGDHDFKVREVRWVSVENASKILSYKGEIEMIKKAEKILTEGKVKNHQSK
ncbi:MAG TPA: NUDIX domain-containing protein [Actinobacteria bacterium]|nr:NUDIX domain-containing protein [Actinomycetota bacterium]